MTEPLIAPDVDLRGLDYMPLFGNHLFGSEFNAAASDSEWRAALTLWWAAWNQVPAGSLPNDDGALCRLADLGRDVKTWKKLRLRALHGFTLCSDGRLYHAFICEQAMVAWDKRVKERERKAKWRAEQEAKKAGRGADVPGTNKGTAGGTEQGRDTTVRADGNGMDGNGRDDVKEHSEAKASAATAAPAKTPAELTKVELWTAGKSLLRQQGMPEAQCGTFVGGLVKAHGEADVVDAVRRAVLEQPADVASWLKGALKGKRPASGKHAGFDTKDYRAGVTEDGFIA